MNFDYVVDAHAWINYFSGKGGNSLKEAIEKKAIATPSIAVAEVRKKFLKEIDAGNESNEGALKKMSFIKIRSAVIALDYEIAEKAAEIDFALSKERKWGGLADSVILATTRKLGVRVLTGDQHFKGLKETEFVA